MDRQSPEGFYGSETTLYLTIIIDMLNMLLSSHYRFVKTHKM